MYFKVGKLFNSLQYRVDKSIDETLYKNKAFSSTRWSFLQRNILRWSQRYSYYIFLTFILSILLVIFLLALKERIAPVAAEYFPNWRRLNEWQGAFLAAQLTIVGVIYPLVIGLVAVLIQNKSAKKTLLPIYQLCSGFMFSGLSGLSLSIFIIVGYLISASIADSSYVAISLTGAFWLIFNILLTSWFFATTFLMLNEAKRDRLVVRFTIHELCENDIRSRIKDILIRESKRNKFLIDTDENVLKVTTNYNFHQDVRRISIPSEEELQVKNIQFAIINTIIRYYFLKIRVLYWLKDSRFGRWLSSRKGFGWISVDLQANPEISFLPIWSNQNSALVLATYSGLEIGFIARALIKASISTIEKEDVEGERLTSMMLAFLGTANDAIRDRDIGEFRYAIRNVVNWHVEIGSSLSFINDQGESDNWLMLESPNFFGSNYFDEIMSEYYQIARVAVELIPENIGFFDEVIYLHRKIFSQRYDLAKGEGLSLIRGSYFTWMLLMEWRSFSSSSSDARLVNKYEDVLFDFVGSWESWFQIIKGRMESFKDSSMAIDLYLSHLELTAHTAIAALRYNNTEAAGWGVDMLNNWFEKLTHQTPSLDAYRWNSELITFDMLDKDPDDEAWVVVLGGGSFEDESAFNIALNNASFDLRVITACYMLLKPDLNDDQQIKIYVKALLAGTPIHPTGTVRSRNKKIGNASDVLGAFIRHRDYLNYGEGAYGSWISKVLTSFGRVNEQRRVSGRIYSGWGRDDAHSMSRAYVEVAVSFSKNQWQLDRKWMDIIFSPPFRDQDQVSLIKDLEEWLRLADDLEDSLLTSTENLQFNLENFKFSVQNVIESIRNKRNEILADAEINHEVEERFGVTCSSVISPDELNQKFPLSLFKEISFKGSSEQDALFKVNIHSFPKESVAKGIDATRAINEDEWLRDSIKTSIYERILREIISHETTKHRDYRDIEENLFDIINLSKDISDPVLLVGETELNLLLHEAMYRPELSSKFDILFIDGYGDNYICHIGNIIVYTIYLGENSFNLLTTKRLFKTVEFGKDADGRFVVAEYVPDETKENVGILSLSYWINVTLAKGLPCIKTKLLSDESG